MSVRAIAKRLCINAVNRVMRPALRAAASDVELGMHVRALATTCEYVEKHLPNCVALKSTTEVLEFAVRECPKDGFLCEFGVFQGRSINYLARHLKPRVVHGFDSFQGLPEPWRTGFDKGAFGTPLPSVDSNVVLHKGWFEDTLPQFSRSLAEPRAALLHIDCDLYSSTRTVFEWLGGSIGPGTVVVFDEYFNYPGWQQHEHRALTEYCSASGKTYDYLAYNRLHEQVVIRFR